MRPNPRFKESPHADRAVPVLFAINSKSRQISPARKTTQRFFFAVPELAVVPRDNSGKGTLFFHPLLIPASAWAAIPRTSNLLQVGNSSAHRNVRIAFPWHYSLLSRRFYRALLPNKTSTHFVPKLTQLRICGKLNVYAAWFLRGCSVTGECFGRRHAPSAKRPNSPAVISLNGSKVHTQFLHYCAHRPRQIHACRPLAGNDWRAQLP